MNGGPYGDRMQRGAGPRAGSARLITGGLVSVEPAQGDMRSRPVGSRRVTDSWISPESRSFVTSSRWRGGPWEAVPMMVGVITAFGVAAVSAPVVLKALRDCSLLDVPNERSSHATPVPRGGGLAPVLGILVALVFAGPGGWAQGALIVAVAGYGVLGLAEDIVGVPPLRRLILQVAIAAAALPWLLSGMTGTLAWKVLFAAGVVFWLVGYVNAYNFMDGINGISVAQAVVAGGAWFVIGTTYDAAALAAGGLIVAAASLAFGPFNFPSARMFLGDVGSYAIGGTLAVLGVIGLRAGLPPEAVVAPLGLYLVDTSSTFVRRVIIGETWYKPHCDHRYQRLTKLGWSHTRVTPFVAVVIAACAALGAASLAGSVALRVVADAGLVILLLGYLVAPTALRVRRAMPAVGQSEPTVPDSAGADGPGNEDHPGFTGVLRSGS